MKISSLINPYSKWENELKQARDQKIKEMRAEGRSDEAILEALMEMDATKLFLDRAVRAVPLPGQTAKQTMRYELREKLRKGYIQTLKNA